MTNAPTKPKIYELERCSLYAPVAGNKRAMLTFSIRSGYPRISVFTRTESDNGGKGVINFAFDLEHFLIFLNRLEAIVRSPGSTKEKVTVRYRKKDANQRPTDELETAGELYFGKNEEGVVWLSILQTDRPRIQFEITLSDYHEFFNGKGERLTKGEASTLRSLVIIHVLRQSFIGQAATFRDVSIPRHEGGNDRSDTKSAAPVSSDGVFDDIPY